MIITFRKEPNRGSKITDTQGQDESKINMRMKESSQFHHHRTIANTKSGIALA